MPKSREELKAAVDTCIKTSRVGNCAEDLHGPIREWDVSEMTDMSELFQGATAFNTDISKWKVSRVILMDGMFDGAASFNGDISNWDVSSVTTMHSMFKGATSFNIDISKWDVSSVTSMEYMFNGAISFSRTVAWLNARAKKTDMFAGSSGGLHFGRVFLYPINMLWPSHSHAPTYSQRTAVH